MSSGQVDPIANPQAWDIVYIGSVACPGYCEVGQFKRAHEFDVKKGKGTLGATITFVGRPPAKGTIKFYLWTPQHFIDWDSFRPLLKYDPTKTAVQAIDIYHPSLADIDLNAVVTESIGNIIHEGKQLYSCTVEFLEYFPPPKTSAVSTPTTATANADPKTSANQAPTAPDAQQVEASLLFAQAATP